MEIKTSAIKIRRPNLRFYVGMWRHNSLMLLRLHFFVSILILSDFQQASTFNNAKEINL